MSMSTVDLDNLAADLTAAGVRFADYDRGDGRQVRLVGITVWEDRWETTGMTNRLVPDPMFWIALDIIRRHIAPPVPDLHATLIEIFNRHTTSQTVGDNVQFFDFDGFSAANEVLQLLGYPGVERPKRAPSPPEEEDLPF